MSWLKKVIKGIRTVVRNTTGIPENSWIKCESCGSVLYRAEFERNLMVCLTCNHHHRVKARKRLAQLLDPETSQEIGQEIEAVDRLKFKDQFKYKDRLNRAVVCAAFEFDFMGGSMGTAVGERFVRGVLRAIEEDIPFICVSASGGARMQEGLFSLMQMAKTSAALGKLKQKGLPFISVLTHPTMGGVSASFASLGDIIIAEPNALIGFAGPRVIEQTVRQVLPEGFQRSEFLLAHGAIDMIVDRKELKAKIASLLNKLMAANQARYSLTAIANDDNR